MIKRIFTGIYHFLWYFFAIIIISAAVLVTVVRLALPGIGEYKNEIQAWVSEYMTYPLVINEINAEWQGWTPHLFLTNIDLYTKDNSHIITKFDSAKVGIDLMSSMIEREIVPSNLSISGVDLELIREVDGSIRISTDQTNNINNLDNGAALSEWLLKQKYIILENAQLTWNDKKSSSPAKQFDDVRLDLKTDENRLQVNASVRLPEEYGNSISAKIDVKGNVLTPDWNGEIFVSAENINPGDLLAKYPVKTIGGNANIQFWTSWKKARLIDFSGKIDYADFVLSSVQNKLPVKTATVNLYGERQKNKNWDLSFKLEHVETINGVWPASNYQFRIEENDSEDNYRYTGYLSYLNLNDIFPFLISSQFIPVNALDKIDLNSIRGELKNIDFIFDPYTQNNFLFHTHFNNLAFSSQDKQNKINNLQGTLTSNSKKLSISLESQRTELNIGSIYEHTIPISKLNADMEFIFNETPELVISKMDIVDNDLSVNLSGKIKFDKPAPFLDLIVHSGETSIERIPYYLPKQIKQKTYDWLKHALAGGKILSGDLVYRGHINEYPFEEDEGICKAILNVSNATVDYHDGWPPVDNFTADILLENDDLTIVSNSGYIFDARIDELTAHIKDIGKNDAPHVIIKGNLSGHTSDVRLFIEQSPLKNNSSLHEFSQTNIAGNLKLDLNLDFPLNENHTVANGTLSLIDTTIESSLPGLGLEDVNGKIEFTRDHAWASDIKALYFGKPVTLSMPLDENEEAGSSTFKISGLADKAFIIEQLSSFFPSLYAPDNELNNYFDGESHWALTIKRTKGIENTTNNLIELSSDLAGITINLPYPLGKSKTDVRPLSIKTQLINSKIDRIDLNYDNTIYTNILVDNSAEVILKKILVGLGHEHDSSSVTHDISIQGDIEQLNLSEWLDFINLRKKNQFVSDTSPHNRSILYNIHVDKLKMLDNEFSNTNFTLTQATHGWETLFDGEEIKGQAKLVEANGNLTNKLDVNLEYLIFDENETDEETDSNVAINKLPELNVNINKLTYKNNDLGQTKLITSNINDGINIDTLSFTKPGFSINAAGTWTRIDEIDRSEFKATLESESIDHMLSTFSYDKANIDGGQTTVKLYANWMDTPMNFSIEKINGDLEMTIGQGQFLDINPSAGRLFGLLSIQTLPRRLSLDFTDIFSKGFSFDSISGDFSLQQGHAYTNNLEMNGPSADIVVSGRTGLVTEDYDQIATVTPKISDSLPVTSALFGPIGVGVGAVIFIAGELFESLPKRIDKILSQQYSIKGSWDSPDIKKIKNEKQSG